MDYRKEYDRWLTETKDEELLAELKGMDEKAVEDAFYRDLAFGTGGLRGIIGAGTNRMNVLTVQKASQGLAEYLLKKYKNPSVVIGYDSRLKSDVFAQAAGSVFAANGIKVYAWKELLPVPTVSYAVRSLRASAGVMITASHNPAQYNGYKVYGPDGCQITTEAAEAIFRQIKQVDLFSGIKSLPWESALEGGSMEYISDQVLTDYLEEIKRQSVLYGDKIDKNLAVVYSPLNGTGLAPVTRVLEESGFTNITVVEEQRLPDGRFPTCPYPNPEIREAMELGLQYCEKTGADLLLATDPDCDRCGIAVRTESGGYKLLTGNEVGLLLLDYLCSQRLKHQRMPDHPVFVKTIVTVDLAEKIARHYGLETVNVLTGFKFIGEVIGKLEEQGRTEAYIFGFEESYGYLTGPYVRDKDGVNAAFMICEMFAFFKTRGVSLLDRLSELYKIYGYCRNTLHSFAFPGSSGMQRMQGIMKNFRNGLDYIAGQRVVRTEDYSLGLNSLPKADVMKFYTESGSIVIRPSGTEPKLKVYISVTAANEQEAGECENRIMADLEERLVR